jgi:hypothetical protein
MNNLSKNFNSAEILENSDFNLRENWAIFVGAEKNNKDNSDDELKEVNQTYEEALLSPRNSDSTTQGGSDF